MHTATYKHRRCTVVLRDGERVTGKFIERTRSGRIRLMTAGGVREIQPGNIHQFLTGNKSRDA